MTTKPPDKPPIHSPADDHDKDRGESYLDYKYNLQDKGVTRFFTPNRTVNYSAKLYGSHFETPWHREASGIPAKSERWADSMSGRMAIRTFSRGVLGAGLMAWGQGRALGYDPLRVEKALEHPGMFSNEDVNLYQRNLARIAKFYDNTFGKVWSCVVKPESMRFRGKVLFNQDQAKELTTQWYKDLYELNKPALQNKAISWADKTGVINEEIFASEEGRTAYQKFIEKAFEQCDFFTHKFEHIQEQWLEMFGHPLALPHDPKFKLRTIQGRSYGHEVALMTHDFALGSIGDALGRSIAGVLDPNVYTDWWHEGKFDPVGFAKYMVHTAWNVLSYNQMEDWFAGIAYVHQMRLQRDYIPKLFPGAKHAMDNRSTASYRVDNDGNITGDYTKAGAMDIQARFMGYNFYTLLFRDSYNHLEYMFDDWKKNGFSLHCSMPEHPIASVVNGVDETAKYLGKTFVKSMTYMAPAVPFFWMWRVPQNKSNPLYIHETGIPSESKGPLTISRSRRPLTAVDGEELYHPWLTTNYENVAAAVKDYNQNRNSGSISISNLSKNAIGSDGKIYAQHMSIPSKPFTSPEFNVYAAENTPTTFGRLLNPMGRISQIAGNALGNVFEKMVAPASSEGARNFAQNYVNAALAYTPYMIAKYETANWWDSPFMDAAIYRAEDGITSLKPKEVWEGIKDIGRVIAIKPVSYKTYCDAFTSRGLVNSTQEAIDRANKRDLGFKHSFAEAVRTSQGITPQQQGQPSESPTPPDAVPGTVVSKKPEDYIDVSRLSDNGKATPNGVTIH